MQLKTRRVLVACDSEGRAVIDEFSDGEEIQFIDARGVYQYGVIVDIQGSAIVIEQGGKTRRIPYKVIEHIEHFEQ